MIVLSWRVTFCSAFLWIAGCLNFYACVAGESITLPILRLLSLDNRLLHRPQVINICGGAKESCRRSHGYLGNI